MIDHDGFRLTYWGCTGSLTAPLRPVEVTEKVTSAILMLAESGVLARIAARPTRESILRALEDHVPFSLRSTYGGNTTCIEIQTADELLIVDTGSGFRELGIELSRRWNAPGYSGARRGHILNTHAHMDHTFGTPFFDPYYDPRNDFTIWGPQSVIDSLKAVMDPQADLKGVFFPPTLESFGGLKHIETIKPGMDWKIGKTRVRTMALNHPGGSMAFKFERGPHSFVIATDHEQQQTPDPQLAEFAQGAALIYMDAQYLQAEYEGKLGISGEPPMTRRGWGHSTLEGCLSTAAAAHVKQVHLGHREPKRRDEGLHKFEMLAHTLLGNILRKQNRDPASCVASIAVEGSTFDIQ